MSPLTPTRRPASSHTLFATVWLAAAASLSSGCSSAESIDVQPADECFWGAQFADCGGGGTPRFACRPTGLDCRWFTGGAVAEDYLAWPCADGRICCEDGSDATYPHDLYFAPASFFNVNGAEPWTRERALDLAVTIDPQVTGEVTVHCERDGNPVDDIAPCRVPGTGNNESRNEYFTYATMRDTLSVAVGQADGFVSYRVFVEIFPGEASEPSLARACMLRESDGVAVSCDPVDYDTAEPQCAAVGDIRVSAMPSRDQANLSGVVVEGNVEFPNGLEVSFTVPL